MAKSYDSAPPPPPVSAATSPIGVAPTYQAPANDIFGAPTGTVAPRYFAGAQNTEVAGLSAEDRANLQITLKQLGLIGRSTPVTLGVWDSTSANAFKQVLAWANTTGTTWQQALADMQQSGAAFDANSAPAQVKEASNALDIKALGNQTALNYTGRGLTADQLTSFTSDFQSAEAPYLSSDASTSAPNAAGWEEWAKTKVRNFDPVNFDAHKVLAGVDVLAKMLGAG